MRDICCVIAHLNSFIPDSVVKVELEAIAKGAAYHSPEQQGPDWAKLERCLWEKVGTPDCDWKQRVSDVVEDREKIPKPNRGL